MSAWSAKFPAFCCRGENTPHVKVPNQQSPPSASVFRSAAKQNDEMGTFFFWSSLAAAAATFTWSVGGEERLFAVHWTHVPKAGGTAMASLARRVACVKNPWLAVVDFDVMNIEAHEDRWLNPCCVPGLCVSEISCHATASTCPLVQGIGRHTSSMMQLADMACCSREWFDRTKNNFFRSAWRAPPSEADMARVAGEKSSGFRTRVKSYELWPLESRLAFFATMGFHLDEIIDRAVLTKIFERNLMTRERAMEIYRAFSRPRATIDETVPASTRVAMCHRAAQTLHASAVAKHFVPEWPSPGYRKRIATTKKDAKLWSPHCATARAGENSMTLLRDPFTRLASAYFYRGHSPNQDNYGLRPGVFRPVFAARGGKAAATNYHRFSFREFVALDEYRNIMTKMFGDSFGCEATERCKRRPPCEALSECHAYRNASLTTQHVDAAFDALERHAFVGLLEVYNASTKLAMRTFGVEPDPEGRDFKSVRRSSSNRQQCTGGAALRLSSVACRDSFRQNTLDYLLYEKVHRLFCARLREANLLNQPDIQIELKKKRLCGSTDFSNVESACGHLDANTTRLDQLTAQCGRRRTARWDWGYAT